MPKYLTFPDFPSELDTSNRLLKPVLFKAILIVVLSVVVQGLLCPTPVQGQYNLWEPLTSPNAEAEGRYGIVTGIGDVNGDSVPDALVGAFRETVSDSSAAGRAYLISGSDGSLLQTLESPNVESSGLFGVSVAGVGDTNGDGTPDMLVGASETVDGKPDAGRAYLFSGSDGSLLRTLESPNVGNTGSFGNAVEGISDINGDDTPDLIVGATSEAVSDSGGAGRTYLISGTDGSHLHTLESPNIERVGRFGASVAEVGDSDGDGVPDVLVGARGETVGGNDNAGRAYLFSGADGSLLQTLESPNAEEGGLFGIAVAGISDLNGDNTPDLIVGAAHETVSGSDIAGRAYLFSGADGSRLQAFASPNVESIGRFGHEVTGIGDLNGDAIPDILIGATSEDGGGINSSGRAYLFSGTDGRLFQTLESPNAESGGRFGDVTGIGDVNGDSVRDVLVGARQETAEDSDDSGRAYVFATIPSPPLGLEASAMVNSVGLEWNGVEASDLQRYRIYRATTPIDSTLRPSNYTPLDSTVADSTTYVDNNVTTGTTYYYRVTAVDTASSESAFSGQVRATPVDRVPPDVPVALAATTTPDSVSLSWERSDSSDVNRYHLYRDTAPIDSTVGPSAYVPLDSTAAGDTTYTDKKVQRDTTYFYRVTAVDTASNESSFSREVEAMPESPAVSVIDGRVGFSYLPPSPTPGTQNNPLGRVLFTSDHIGAKLSSLTVANDGSALQGVTSAKLWRSADSVFAVGEDSLLASDSTAIPFTFDRIDMPIPTDTTHLFVVADLDSTAGGDYAPVVQSEEDIVFQDGALAQVNGTDDSTFSNLHLSSEATALPVEITALKATLSGETVVLNWTTASEKNNSGFAIERRTSVEGSTSWLQIGFVEGEGTTSASHTYRFEDKDPAFSADSLTYRLRQIDTDGSRQFSETVSVQRGVDEVRLLDPYPNPVRHQAIIHYALPEKQHVNVRLYDILGRKVRTVVNEKQEGRNEYMLDVRGLSSGVYFLQLRTETKMQTQKLTVMQ